MSQFQLIVIGIMVGLALVAVLFLSGVIPGFSLGGGDGGGGVTANLVIWGDVPQENIRDLITFINDANAKSFTVDYIEKQADVYEKELVGALAAGKGPDIWLLSQDMILKNKDKIFLIPFESFSERAFKDIFIEEGELYLFKGGIAAFPLLVDPIILYWNRDLFSLEGISKPPKTWDEFVNFSEKLTSRDNSGNITRSGTALGEFQNIDHAKEILSFLILQTGNPIVEPASLRSVLVPETEAFFQSGENASRFFTEFSNPSKISYSWNKALTDAKSAFISGTLAMYFGYAGEYNDIVSKNPHLNFDVAEIPQIKDGKIRATFAKIKGLAISKTSANAVKAFSAVIKLTEKDAVAKLAEKTFLPPVRRDLLAQAPKNPILSVFYKSAIYAKGWLEPDPITVSEMFRSMIESVNTGKRKINEAVKDVHLKLDIMLRDYEK